jgi:superfamily II RNA helicase
VVLTELIFGGVLNALPPPHVAALLSCFLGLDSSKDVVLLATQARVRARAHVPVHACEGAGANERG